uniref:Uncharacterized protein n=1 Tax=Felis catus TaxID=9685 RepID=A0ABI7XZ36_FELCA
MASDRAKPCELDQEKYDADDNVKIICLGDSAVGKSKLLGHSRPGAVPEHACLLLPQGPRLHHGVRCAEESHLQEPEHLVHRASGVQARDPVHRGGQ